MTGPWLPALITAFASVVVAAVAYGGSRHAQRDARTAKAQQAERDSTAARHVIEAEAYERARQSYEKIVADLERQVERTQRAMAAMAAQLTQEQSVSGGLRSRVWTLEDQVQTLHREVGRSKQTMAEHHGTLRADLRKAGVDLPDEPDTG